MWLRGVALLFVFVKILIGTCGGVRKKFFGHIRAAYNQNRLRRREAQSGLAYAVRISDS